MVGNALGDGDQDDGGEIAASSTPTETAEASDSAGRGVEQERDVEEVGEPEPIPGTPEIDGCVRASVESLAAVEQGLDEGLVLGLGYTATDEQNREIVGASVYQESDGQRWYSANEWLIDTDGAVYALTNGARETSSWPDGRELPGNPNQGEGVPGELMTDCLMVSIRAANSSDQPGSDRRCNGFEIASGISCGEIFDAAAPLIRSFPINEQLTDLGVEHEVQIVCTAVASGNPKTYDPAVSEYIPDLVDFLVPHYCIGDPGIFSPTSGE